MTTQTTTHDVAVTRVFDAPVARVWRAWTDSDQVKQWWGPTGFTCPVADMDFREGGTSLVCMRAPQEFGGGDMYSTWTYTSIVPMQRIEYLHHFADKDANRIDPASLGLPPDMPYEVNNIVTFQDLSGGRTELSITESSYPSDQLRDLSKAGLEQCLDKMASALAQP